MFFYDKNKIIIIKWILIYKTILAIYNKEKFNLNQIKFQRNDSLVVYNKETGFIISNWNISIISISALKFGFYNWSDWYKSDWFHHSIDQ